jgi:FtsZ-interacting cell division protein YlmF
MSLWLAIMRFFGLAEPAGEEEIIEYPSQEQKRPPPADAQVLDYRREAQPQQHQKQPDVVKLAVLRPELNRHGRVTFSLAVYTENLREGYILLVDVSRVVNQNREEARKIVNFLSGVAEAIRGRKFEVAPNIYLFVPPNVQIKGDVLRDEEE